MSFYVDVKYDDCAHCPLDIYGLELKDEQPRGESHLVLYCNCNPKSNSYGSYKRIAIEKSLSFSWPVFLTGDWKSQRDHISQIIEEYNAWIDGEVYMWMIKNVWTEGTVYGCVAGYYDADYCRIEGEKALTSGEYDKELALSTLEYVNSCIDKDITALKGGKL